MLISIRQFTQKYNLDTHHHMFYKRVIKGYENAPKPCGKEMRESTKRFYHIYDENELLAYLERIPLTFNRKKENAKIKAKANSTTHTKKIKPYKVLQLINTRLNIDLNPNHDSRKKLIEKEKNKRRFRLDKLNKQRPFRTKNYFTEKEKYTEGLRPTYIQYLDSITHNAETHVISHNERY